MVFPALKRSIRDGMRLKEPMSARTCGRREFVGGALTLAATAGMSCFANKTSEIKAALLHMGMNMWGDWLAPGEEVEADGRMYSSCHVRFDESVWRETTAHMAGRGLNMVLIDLGEFMEFPSHPELAVQGSWSPERMRAELVRLREIGLEPIPKLNFSATHDQWLQVYHRMLSTPKYYEVVKDVIRDTAKVFDAPRFFHLGWDEEGGFADGKCHFSARSGNLWWHDFLFTVKCVEDCGCRAWTWSDYGWSHRKEYLTKCPKSVLQSNWYYDEWLAGCSPDPKVNKLAPRVSMFLDLEKAGFDQVPCGSNWTGWGPRHEKKVGGDDVIGAIVSYCRKNIAPDRLKGFLMAPWTNCSERGKAYEQNMRGIDLLADALIDR